MAKPSALPASQSPVIAAVRTPPDHEATASAALGFRLVSARLEGDKTFVIVGWDTVDLGATTGWHVEAAAASSGPFRPIARGVPVEGVAGRATIPLEAPTTWLRLVLARSDGATSQSAPIRALSVTATGYDLGRVSVPYAPDHRGRVRAIVRYPSGIESVQGSLPLAIITHGNAGVCRDASGVDVCVPEMVVDDRCPDGMVPTPSAEGLVWIAESLATRGYIAISVDAASVNCTPLPVIVQGRASLILEHLRLWGRAVRGKETPLGGRFAGRVDLGRVALIGHSNGAEASAMVPHALDDARLQPQLAGVRVRSIVAIAGSDSLWVSPASTPFLVVQPSCDMQLPAQDGLRLLDRGLQRRSAPQAVAYVVGTTHNGVNRSWHRDESLDHPDGAKPSSCAPEHKVAPWRQRATVDALVGDWLEATVRSDAADIPAWLKGQAAMPTAVAAAVGGKIDIRFSYFSATKLVIESFDGDDAPRRNDLGGLNRIEGFASGGRCFASHCDDAFAHTTWGARLDWRQPGARFAFEVPPVDAQSFDTLSLRVTQNPGSELVTPGAALDFNVHLADAAGHRATVAASAIGGLPFPSTAARSSETVRHFHGVLQTLRLPLKLFTAAAPELDLHRIVLVELTFDRPGHGHGSVILSHVELSRD